MINKIKDIYSSLEKLWISIDKDEKNYLLGGAIIISLFGLSIIFILPWLFTRTSISLDDYKDLGGIGDTINGIAGPFIALLAAILTFLAFYVQYKANKQQRTQFEVQIFDLKNEQVKQEKQQNKSQFENQFYEMLRLHKENVSEIFIKFIEYRSDSSRNYDESVDTMVYGRKTFEYMVDEFEAAYSLAKDIITNESIEKVFNHAYSIFFHGIKLNNLLVNLEENQTLYIHFVNAVIQLKKKHKENRYKNLFNGTLKFLSEDKINLLNKSELEYKIFEGYSSFLGHYYRHLFQTVKFVVNKDFLSYEEKRNYLRILRAQLSNHEQVMLYYNWKAGYGHKWENKDNKFFTDYRMIHNISNEMLFEDFKLEYDFNLNNKKLKKEKGRKIDPLFEFQD